MSLVGNEKRRQEKRLQLFLFREIYGTIWFDGQRRRDWRKWQPRVHLKIGSSVWCRRSLAICLSKGCVPKVYD